MVDENPAFLPVGTEVSAKFKGAYCEARVKKVQRDLKVKVNFKEHPFGAFFLPCSEFDSSTKFEVSEITKAMKDGKLLKCQIVSVKDASTYHVVFNDGDEKTLRRSQMVLKGKKHFPTEGNLDMMPLTNPESFSSPVIRGAAKRGAQKTKSMTSESDSRKRMAEDDDDEPATKKTASKQRGRDQRRRTTASTSTANNRTGREARSDAESSDDSSEKNERRKRRDEEKAGPSTSSRISSEDELSVPSTSNGAITAAKAEKIRIREIKLQEKEIAKKKKDEERERKRSEKEEAKRKREADRNIKRAASRHTRDMKRLFKSAIVKAAERESKIYNKTLIRPSTRYVWRPFSLGKKRRRKKALKRRGLVTLRNCRLCNDWTSVCRLIKMPSGAKRYHCWSRVTTEHVNELTEAYDFLSSEEAVKLASKWLRGLENVRKWKFVLLYENPNKVRRLLPNLNLPECTFSERMDIAKGDINGKFMGRSLERDEWYVGILLPQPYPPPSSTNGVQRLVRHLATGELIRVWEDDLLPFSWVPSFVQEDMKYIAKQRPADRKHAFLLAWKFVTSWKKSRLCKQFMISRCGLRSHPQKRITAESGIPTTAPPPPQIYDEGEESEESESSDSDSDSSIINAPDDEKALCVASYMSYYDNRNVKLPPLSIQSCDIDIFYFQQLVKRFGGARKASAPGAHWTTFAKKLIPGAVDAENELRAWYRENLEPFMMIQNKLPMDSLLPRSKRQQIRPGQYSESRKRKSVTLQDVDRRANSSAPTYSNSRRGGRGGGRGRKRKTTPDERHRGKRERRSESSRRGSRATTASPEPSGQLHEDVSQSDDDDTASSLFSADGSERKGYRQRRQKKTPTRTTGSRNSRSASARHDDLTPAVPAKKGRPRKHATTSASKQTAKKPRECDLSGFVFANILSQVHTTQYLHACYTDGGWWAATAISDMDDFTEELMDVMLDHQATNPSYVTTMSSDTESRLKEIYDKLRVATHYKGWNQRYDEDMKLDKLMVRAEDQLESRRRFRRLPRGSELLPETMALVEDKMTTQHQITDGSKTRPRVSREEFVRLAREALSSTKSKNDGAKQESRPRKIQDSDDEEPELKEEESDSNESDNDDDQPGPSSKGEKKKEEVSSDEDDDGDDGDDDDDDEDDDDDDTVVMVPASKDESHKRKSSEHIYAERGFESESDEPEYPPGPSSPELLAMRPPILQNVTSLDRISSSGSSNYPVLSRQASNTSVNSSMQSLFSPPNSLSHSGPLTLAEVPPSESSSVAKHPQRHDNNEEVRGEREEPKAVGDTGDAEPVHKKSRKNEPEAFRALASPIRLPTAPQFQSGALTLDIPPPAESSGPIEPTSSVRKSRKKTGTPVLQKPSPSITSSGPLTLSPSKTRPPGSSPLGRPKRKSQTEAPAAVSTSTESDHEEEESPTLTQNAEVLQASETVTAGSVSGKESQEGTSGSTTPATIDDKEDDSTDKELDKTPQSQSTPRGSSARGKRKRGGRFGGSYSTKPTKVVKRKEKDENEEEKDDDAPFVTPTPTHSARADSFQVQKNRMAKLMEQEGTSEAYHLLDTLSDFDMTYASMHPEDIIMCLEERTTELREAHGQCKQELSQLEKRVRLQNEARRKAAETRTPSSSSSTNAPKN